MTQNQDAGMNDDLDIELPAADEVFDLETEPEAEAPLNPGTDEISVDEADALEPAVAGAMPAETDSDTTLENANTKRTQATTPSHVKCPHCGARVCFIAEFEGRRIKCPACSLPIKVTSETYLFEKREEEEPFDLDSFQFDPNLEYRFEVKQDARNHLFVAKGGDPLELKPVFNALGFQWWRRKQVFVTRKMTPRLVASLLGAGVRVPTEYLPEGIVLPESTVATAVAEPEEMLVEEGDVVLDQADDVEELGEAVAVADDDLEEVGSPELAPDEEDLNAGPSAIATRAPEAGEVFEEVAAEQVEELSDTAVEEFEEVQEVEEAPVMTSPSAIPAAAPQMEKPKSVADQVTHFETAPAAITLAPKPQSSETLGAGKKFAPPTAPAHFKCPSCGLTLKYKAHFEGRPLDCPRCQHRFRVSPEVYA